MKLRTVAPAATVALAALALLAGCKKGDSNANGANTKTTVNTNATANTAPAPPLGATTTTAASASTPTEAFRLYYEAIKRRDISAFRGLISRATLTEIEDTARKMNKPADDFIKQIFDMVGSDLPAAVPETRNEQVNGDRATLEGYDPKKGKWETMHFVNEGGWKISSPGEGSGPSDAGVGDDSGGDDDKGGGDDGDHGGH